MTGLLDAVVVVLELVSEPVLDPEDEPDDEEPLPVDEVSLLLLDAELLVDGPLPVVDDEEPLPELFLVAPAFELALVVVAPWVTLPLPAAPLELLLPWPDVELEPLDEPALLLVPDRFVPEVPELFEPPTIPMRASTSHRTTVFEALSSVPFSMIASDTSPKSTSQSSSADAVLLLATNGCR